MRSEFGLAAAVGAALLAAACGPSAEPTMPTQSDAGNLTAPAAEPPAAAPVENTTGPAPAENATAPAPAAAAPAATPAAAAPSGDLTQKLLAELPEPYRSGDVKNGKIQFSKCLSCHTAVQGGPNLTGPNLFGVFGRKAGSKTDFMYSDAIKASGLVWDAEHIDNWLEKPTTYVKGTKMVFVGLPSKKSRTDLIAYLKVASGGGPS